MTALWGQRPPVLRHCAHQLPSPVNRSNLGLLGGRPVPCQLRARPAKSAAGAQRIVVARAAPASQTATPEVKEAVSHLRYERGSALKFRRVLDQIRGRSYPEALYLLEHMPYRACEPLKSLLIAAAADAKHNFQMTKTKLFISECYASQAGIIKRFRPRARGRGYKISKGVSHITLKVREGIEVNAAPTAEPSEE